jgi:hypothetical protein
MLTKESMRASCRVDFSRGSCSKILFVFGDHRNTDRSGDTAKVQIGAKRSAAARRGSFPSSLFLSNILRDNTRSTQSTFNYPTMKENSLTVAVKFACLLAFKSTGLNFENFLRTENDRSEMMIPDCASSGRNSREGAIIPRFPIVPLSARGSVLQIGTG